MHLLLCLNLSMYIKDYFYVEICHIIYPSFCFKFVLILTWSQGLNINGISIFNLEFSPIKFWRIKILLTWKILKDILKQIYITCSIYELLAVAELSHQSECVNTKITSITEEYLFRNRHISQVVLEEKILIFQGSMFAFSFNITSWKRAWSFTWTKFNSLHPRMLCAKIGWNWPSGSWVEDENVYCLQMNRQTDEQLGRQTQDRRSGKLISAFCSVSYI